MQRPIASETEWCPLWKRRCSTACHTCPLYVQVRGKHPQSGIDLDQWSCSLAILPMLMINVAKEVHHGAAATESMRNEIVKAHHQQVHLATAIAMSNRDGYAGDFAVEQVVSDPHRPRMIEARD